jgi:ABC-type amino acid transport substrate-binding protein
MQKATGKGFSLSTPYFYSGTTFAGVPEMVDCANRQDTIFDICRGLQVCVLQNTVTEQLIDSLLSGTATVPTVDSSALFENFANGTCNVIAGAPLLLFEQRVRDVNYTGAYTLGGRLFSKEPLGMVSRGDDDEWADFVNWVLNALITAEAMNITHDRADEFPTTDLFGEEYKDMFRNAIAAVGNYGEMYDRHYAARSPRADGLNRLNTGESGLMYSKPFGSINTIDPIPGQDPPGPIANGTLEAIANRGHLRCGILSNRTGFAEYNSTNNISRSAWSGIDVDYCLALSATIFPGVADASEMVLFVDHSSLDDGFVSLGSNVVDVLAGGIVSLKSNIREPTTGKGYAFSVPYFYGTNGNGNDGTVLALASRHEDPQWSDFIRWVVYATIHAEEENITHGATALDMPVVEVFGLKYLQMFRDVIVTIGNYGQIYDRNLQSHIPRAGRNLLNDNDGPQLLPFPF